jgi:hypothetical protein
MEGKRELFEEKCEKSTAVGTVSEGTGCRAIGDVDRGGSIGCGFAPGLEATGMAAGGCRGVGMSRGDSICPLASLASKKLRMSIGNCERSFCVEIPGCFGFALLYFNEQVDGGDGCRARRGHGTFEGQSAKVDPGRKSPAQDSHFLPRICRRIRLLQQRESHWYLFRCSSEERGRFWCEQRFFLSLCIGEVTPGISGSSLTVEVWANGRSVVEEGEGLLSDFC